MKINKILMDLDRPPRDRRSQSKDENIPASHWKALWGELSYIYRVLGSFVDNIISKILVLTRELYCIADTTTI